MLSTTTFKNGSLIFLSVVLLLVPGLSGCGKSPRILPDIKPKKLTYKEGSIWPEQAVDTFLFKDNKAKNVGDTITVLIMEDVKAVNNLSLKTARASDHSANLVLDDSPKRYGIEGGSKFSGTGATTKSGSIKAVVTAMVMEVLPNGNLRIDGRKVLDVNNDKQIINITGIARPEDISRANSVVSTHLAESQVVYSGEGSLSSSQKPGYIGRFLAFLWPF